ncbi:flagellar FlbD family protein [Vallitalea pronyensis]|uniref:Flagellar FlbD family protein n=1 Tax=Vallitalea pronyensis TaxID=1348613 RepID=A0A8J8SHC7_9FIRM|nr:flagellar FlbD family protein [Vallitalea pronyensis]QUI23233.1 flagellar FlbD family protein [Vallitalea pronyensis]
MIYVTKLNDEEVVVNCDLIEVIEETPNTIITLTTGKKIIAKESSKEIIEKIIRYKTYLSKRLREGHDNG